MKAKKYRSLQEAVTRVCDSLEVAPDAEKPDDALGDYLLCRLARVKDVVWDQVWGALHYGVQVALAVVRSGYIFDLSTVVKGFICEPNKTEEEADAACVDLMRATEEPAGVLARRFEDFVRYPRVEAGDPPLEE